LTPVVSDAEDSSIAPDNQASFRTDGSLEVIKVGSGDEGMDNLKKELGMPACHPFLLSPSFISTLSSCPENLEVPYIFIFQQGRNY
jgi:hypothetical protein